MGGAVAGNVLAGLRPGNGIGAMGMDNAPQLGKCLVKLNVGLGVAAGVQVSLHHAAMQIHHHQLFRCQCLIFHAAGLYHQQPRLPVNAGDIAPGEGHQIPAGQLHIGVIYLFSQFFQHIKRPPGWFSS